MWVIYSRAAHSLYFRGSKLIVDSGPGAKKLPSGDPFFKSNQNIFLSCVHGVRTGEGNVLPGLSLEVPYCFFHAQIGTLAAVLRLRKEKCEKLIRYAPASLFKEHLIMQCFFCVCNVC